MSGLFDESLVRNQDDELNLRIRAGRRRGSCSTRPFGSHYAPRGSFRSLFRQYYEYGLWKIPVMRKHRGVLSARSLAPAAFVGSLAVLAPAALRSKWARRALTVEVTVYGATGIGFAAEGIRRRSEKWTLLPRVLAAFPTFHLGYGLGMLAGLVHARRRP